MEITVEETERAVAEALVRAAQNGDEEKVKNILQRGEIDADIEYNSETALFNAARNDHVGTCRVLLNHGADCNKIMSQKTALCIAAVQRNMKVVEVMLATEKCTQENLDETFLVCAEIDWFEGCKSLVEAGASVNTTRNVESIHFEVLTSGDTYHLKPTALHFAADWGDEELVNYLVDRGANVNATIGTRQKTPMHLAIANGSVGVLEILLRVPNLLPNIPDSDDNTPLMTAIKLYKKDCVRAFFKHDCWPQCMSVRIMTNAGHRVMDTPMRLLICHMPDVALECMDRCIDLSSDHDSKDLDFNARFYFGFLDDTYTSTNWIATTGPNASSNTAETMDRNAISMETVDEEAIDGANMPRTVTDHWTTRFRPSMPEEEQRLDCNSQCFRCVPGTRTRPCNLKMEAKQYCEKSWLMKMNHPLMIAYNEKATDIFCHPLAAALINYKWREVGRFFCYGRLIFMLLYVGLLMTQVLGHWQVDDTENDGNTQDDVRFNIEISLAVLTVVSLLKEAVAIYSQPAIYFSRMENYSDLLLCVLVIILVVVGVKTDNFPHNLAAICVFLAWFNISLALRKLPVIGIFFVMFTKILKNSIVVLIIFFPVLLGFAFTFSILLDTHPLFNKDRAIATVVVMLSGEVEYVDTMLAKEAKINPEITHPDTLIAAYVFFIVVMVICLLNLLVGIAVSDVNNLRNEAEGEMMTMKAEEVLACEFHMLRFFRRKLARGCLTLYPNRMPLFLERTGKVGLVLRKRINAWSKMLGLSDEFLSAEKLLQTKKRAHKHNDLESKIDKCVSQLEMCLRSLRRDENGQQQQRRNATI